MATRPVPGRRLRRMVSFPSEPRFVPEYNALLERVEALEQVISSVLQARPGALGNLHVRTPDADPGIPAATDKDTPGSAWCRMRIFTGTQFVTSAAEVLVFNRGGDVPGNADIPVIPMQGKQGFLFTVAVYCYTPPDPA